MAIVGKQRLTGSIAVGRTINGEDGFSPVVTVEPIEGGQRITIVDAAGEHVFTVMDGEKGDTGAIGPEGPQGEKGADGAQGPKGDTGATGPEGSKGDKGDQGIQGEQGPKGDTGATGPEGPQGPQGEKGAAGDPGTPGKSAYEYAQDGGYTGTEEEFAEKLAEVPLIGSTAEILPGHVSGLISEGKPFAIMHTDNTYGLMLFNSFVVSQAVGGVVSSTVFELGGVKFCAQLLGNITNNTWKFTAFSLAGADDIPTIPTALPNPKALNLVEPGSPVYQYDGSVEMTVPLRRAVYIDITTEDGETWSASEDFNNIRQYVQLGFPVYVGLDGYIIPPLGISEESIDFALTLAAGDAFVIFVVSIASDDSVSVDMIETTSLPNPHAITINGTTYDGSEAKDVTDTINGMIDAKLAQIPNASGVSF